MKHLIIFFSAFSLIACQKNKETSLNVKPADTLKIGQDSYKTEISSGNILVENFTFPKEIKECSCYFAKSKSDFEAEKFIYADDVGKTAYMKLDGKRLSMNLLSSSDMEVDEDLNKEIESENYKISVKGKKVKNEEALLFEGTLTIEKSDGASITMPIYGECGC
ncbi:hypothetical protein D1632_15220 [Chryseobacterium nematophagum]|uniref:Lipoprotein n=1 Tax=Chryseobacterium nematophagum TaxID=2305228 RepID=A0A3M7L8I1_9FLAO|nr:hypothetical protein [Chryseobacterium nematophagum]RMZ58917.1 hypothetical protein D1632_15220 [Chryseobacterium nematophagum]